MISDFKEGKTTTLKVGEKDYEVTSAMFLKLEKTTKTTYEEKYLPGVIEPSYGVGRVIWAIFEHNF
jgi:glycyl-tRNA synthetase